MNNLNNARFGGTFCLAKAGLAEGTSANTLKTAAAVDYTIDGVFYTKAITDNIAMTALAEQADLTGCLYLVQIDTAGTVSLKKGVERLTVDLDENRASLEWPRPDENRCPIGGFRVDTSGGTFTSGTTDLSDAAVTDTYFDLFSIPSEVVG